MRKKVLNTFIIALFVIFFPFSIKAQLFVEDELYPTVSVIKGKYYSGTGSGEYWSLKFLDSIGRVIIKESYHKKRLMSRQKQVYDNNNNKIFEIQTFDYNNPERVDTFRYEYKYDNNRIIYQFRKLSENDSNVIQLIENQGDTLLKYQEKDYFYSTKTNKTDVYETIITLKYKNGLMICKEDFDKEQNTTTIERYEYYENGRLKHRLIERIPEPKVKGLYIGGPGSDDEFYEYKFDSKGRIKVEYRIIDEKKYKIAVYSYK